MFWIRAFENLLKNLEEFQSIDSVLLLIVEQMSMMHHIKSQNVDDI